MECVSARRFDPLSASKFDPGRINRNHQEVILATGNPSIHHDQFVYVLRALGCRRQSRPA
jgi:hypothetical protein